MASPVGFWRKILSYPSLQFWTCHCFCLWSANMYSWAITIDTWEKKNFEYHFSEKKWKLQSCQGRVYMNIDRIQFSFWNSSEELLSIYREWRTWCGIAPSFPTFPRTMDKNGEVAGVHGPHGTMFKWFVKNMHGCNGQDDMVQTSLLTGGALYRIFAYHVQWRVLV